MIKEALIVKTTALPQSRVALELEIPSNTCKSCVNETINSISRSAKIPGFKAWFQDLSIIFSRAEACS